MLKGKAMSQRQRAKTQGSSLTVAWQDLPWKKIHRHVFRLQKRIAFIGFQGLLLSPTSSIVAHF